MPPVPIYPENETGNTTPTATDDTALPDGAITRSAAESPPSPTTLPTASIASLLTTKSVAIEAFRQRFYENSIRLLLELRSYPSIWNDALAQKPGQAHLRHAVEDHLPEEDQLANLAIAELSLQESLNHRDEGYQAASHYELSKVGYRYFKLTGNAAHMAEAKRQIEMAIQLTSESRFATWLEYLERAESDT